MKRENELLENAEFDCVVIGGGIQGAGIAREACLQGLKTLIIDRGDFASGTSSRSTKLIHGGLRYLEHGRINLVKESLKERKVVMSLAPHLVKPLPFLFPVYQGDKSPLWQIKIGISIYDFLAGKGKFEKHQNLSKQKISELVPEIKSQGLTGGCVYWDAQMNDSRLCLEVLKAAHGLGCRIANYMRLASFTKKDGKITGATLKDLKTGAEVKISSKIFINATGVWCDAVRRMDDPNLSEKIRMSKGVHLVTRRLVQSKTDKTPLAIVLPTKDKRIFFVIPWMDNTTLIGTTDTEYKGKPSECYADKDDVKYLLNEFNRVFPRVELRRKDVHTTFSGLRALVEEPGVSSARLSREYEIEELDSGLISILGGKYTTFRSLSEKVVRRILVKLGEEPRYEDTSCLSLGGLMPEEEDKQKQRIDLERRAKYYGLSKEVTDRLWKNYGTHILEIFKLLDYDLELAKPVIKNSLLIKAEIVYSIKDEMILTLTDFFRRRCELFFTSTGGLDLLDSVAKVYQEYLHWSDEEIDRQKDGYRDEVRRNTKVLDEVLK